MKKIEIKKHMGNIALLNKRNSLYLLSFLIILMFVSLIWYLDYESNSHNSFEESYDSLVVDQRTSVIVGDFNHFFEGLSDDLLFLSNINSLNMVLESDSSSKIPLEKDFYAFMLSSTDFYQLRYIDEMGTEIVRIDYNGNSYNLISEENLQNKKGRYYFDDTMELSKGQIFISPADLNIEQGMLENRGSEENPKYVPVVRFATPVFYNEEPKGIVIINLYMDYLLDKVRTASRPGVNYLLINEEGYYLANSDKNNEYSFMFDDKGFNFFNEYSEIPPLILDNHIKEFFTDNYYFSFDYINPSYASYALSSSYSNTSDNWILVTVSDQDDLIGSSGFLENIDVFVGWFFGMILLLIFIISFLLVFKMDE